MMLFLISAGVILLHLQAYTFTPGSDKFYGTGREKHCMYEYKRYVPRQLHLSLGKNSSEIYVTWSTLDPVIKTRLVYEKYQTTSGPESKQIGILTATEIEVETKFTAANSSNSRQGKRILYNYRAKMTNIEPGSSYIYQVESLALAPSGPECRSRHFTKFHSNRYIFRAAKLDDYNEPITVAMYGDLGLTNGQSIDSLTADVDQMKYDLIIHNGDFAYDLNTDGGRNGDRFMQAIEPIAARVPYQTSVGNHEIKQNFTHYDSRFTMVNGGPINHGELNNFFYSFNAGPVHFVAISTEFYYFLNSVGPEPLRRQYEWLKEDLRHASSPAERALRPWIIVYGHRPMYCSSRDNDDCTKRSNLLRVGFPFTGAYALEKLFYDFGVDLELYAHEHQYERFLPLYNYRVYNGTDSVDDPYLNPRAPVHIISGAAGNDEDLDPFQGKAVEGSIRQISAYGYTVMSASRCRLEFKHVSSDVDQQQVLDSFAITKTRHTSFPQESPIDLKC